MKRRIPPFDDCHHAGGLMVAALHRRLAMEERARKRAKVLADKLADKLDLALEHQRGINAQAARKIGT